LLYTTMFFSVVVVLIFAFSFVKDGAAPADVAPGILWVTLAFSGTLALGRAFEREREAETLRALLLAPVERGTIYLGKLIALVALVTAVEVVILPLVVFLFNAPIDRAPGLVIGLLACGILGFTSVGTLFAAMLVRARSRDVMLPVLLYPITVPVVLAGVRGTAAIFAPTPDLALARIWLTMLIFFDTVFVTLALWTFGAVMTE
jgi:heme exporter protein CcmB